MKTLGERLKWARERKGLSQEELGKAAGMTQGGIGHLEQDLRQTSRRMAQLAHALEVNPLWLAEGKGEPDSQPEILPPSHAPSIELVYASHEELRLLTQFRQATPIGKQLIQTVAESAPKQVLGLLNDAQ